MLAGEWEVALEDANASAGSLVLSLSPDGTSFSLAQNDVTLSEGETTIIADSTGVSLTLRTANGSEQHFAVAHSSHGNRCDLSLARTCGEPIIAGHCLVLTRAAASDDDDGDDALVEPPSTDSISLGPERRSAGVAPNVDEVRRKPAQTTSTAPASTATASKRLVVKKPAKRSTCQLDLCVGGIGIKPPPAVVTAPRGPTPPEEDL